MESVYVLLHQIDKPVFADRARKPISYQDDPYLIPDITDTVKITDKYVLPYHEIKSIVVKGRNLIVYLNTLETLKLSYDSDREASSEADTMMKAWDRYLTRANFG